MRRANARAFLVVITACALFVTACGVTEPQDELAGPCIHEYREPILTIESVTGDPSGASVARVALSSLKLNGQPQIAEEWVATPSVNVSVTAGVLYCDVPCGFGFEEGLYEFVADAADHQTTSISADAQYASFQGRCPSYNDDGTNVSFQLMEN